MGRHRSTLRELGWGVSNSPNPWKQGSAKRVVRTLDYSQADMDEPPPAAAEPPPAERDEKLQQLQQDGARAQRIILPGPSLCLHRIRRLPPEAGARETLTRAAIGVRSARSGP